MQGLKRLSIILLVLFCWACRKKLEPPPEEKSEPREWAGSVNHIVGVDQFGRSFYPISSVKENKQVGLFFWLWIGQPYASGIYDASKILALPNGLKLLTDFGSLNETISPNGQAHFWGEPVWGYYNSQDVWVIRKQMEMLTIAGVDFIFFDATNAFIYKNVFLKLLAVIDEYRQNGWDPPKVVFYTHSRSFQTVRELYRELYKPGLYADTWYRVQGKPMIIAYTEPEDDLREAGTRSDNDYVPGLLSAEILSFFHFVRPQWPSDPVFPDGFPWVEWIFPQPVHNGVMNVTVASHPSVPMSFSLTRRLVNWGRGWDPDSKTNIAEGIDRGTFFQRQWNNALSVNPDMISVGGWNEWIAYKQPYAGEYVLVDAVNKEYSRDIEPMRGGYEDAFYIQMIKNMRAYKGVKGSGGFAKKKTITIASGAAQWDSIPPIGVNINRNRIARNEYGASTTVHYSLRAPENFIQEIKVADDDKNLYFYIRGKYPFTAPGGQSNWLNILIGKGDPEKKGWESYEYCIGRNFDGDQAAIEALDAGFEGTLTGKAKYLRNGDLVQIECPKTSIGMTNGSRFYFKVAAGVENPGDIMSYYTSGSVLPLGRLSYMYEPAN